MPEQWALPDVEQLQPVMELQVTQVLELRPQVVPVVRHPQVLHSKTVEEAVDVSLPDAQTKSMEAEAFGQEALQECPPLSRAPHWSMPDRGSAVVCSPAR